MLGAARRSSFLDIRPGEGAAIWLLLLHSFTLGCAVVYAEIGATTIFLTTFSAAQLPNVYIAAAVVLMLTGLGCTRLGRTLAPGTFLIGILSFLLVGAVSFALGQRLQGAPWLAFGMLTWFWALETLAGLEFWALAGQLFNLQQGKRLYGLIGAGEPAARVIGFFLIPLLVPLIGVENLIPLAAACLVFSLITLLVLIRRFPALRQPVPSGTDERRAERSQGSGLAKLLALPYIRAILITALLSQALYFFVNFGFSAISRERFADPILLAQFLGIFLGALNAGRLIFRLFLSRPLLARYGLIFGLLAVPMTIGAGMVGLVGVSVASGALGATFAIVSLTRLTEGTLRQGVQRTAWQLLYQPLRPEQRLTANILVESGAQPLAMGLTGGFLLLLGQLGRLNTTALAYVGLPLSGLLVFSSIRVYRGYRMAIRRGLRRRRLGDQDLDLHDASTLATLAEWLASPRPAEVLYVLGLLEERASRSWLDRHLKGLLSHPDPLVRWDVAQRMERLQLTGDLPTLLARLAVEDDPKTRAAIVRALGVLGRDDPAVLASVRAYLDDPDPDLRLGAVVGLLRPPRATADPDAALVLAGFADSDIPADRILASRALGFLEAEHGAKLLGLLGDPDLHVRRAALHAARSVRAPALWPTVVEHLGDSGTTRAAAAAMIAGGTGALPALLAAADRADPATLTVILRTAGRIGASGLPLLRDALAHRDGAVRTQALRGLARCHYRATGPEGDRVRLQIRREIAQAASLIAAQTDLAGLDDRNEQVALLRRALATALHQHRVRICLLLSFLYDATAMQRVETTLDNASAERRGYAQEVLSLTLPLHLRAPILPLFEDLSPAQALQRLGATFPQHALAPTARLMALVQPEEWPRSPWLRVCALAMMAAIGDPRCRPVATAALNDSNVLVRTSALQVLARLDGLQYGSGSERFAGGQDLRDNRVLRADATLRNGAEPMLTTIERVIILKSVDIFSRVEDATLAELALLLEESEYPAGATVFEQGDRGTSLYIIVDGDVRVHADGQTINHLGAREVFGEMALLDPEPRMASITTGTECRLLRLDQEPFYELLEDHIDVARGVIQVLSRRLRARVQDLNAARATGGLESPRPTLAGTGS